MSGQDWTRVATWVLLALICAGCTRGLPRELQSQEIQAVVNACWSHGGVSETTLSAIDVVRVTCRIVLKYEPAKADGR